MSSLLEAGSLLGAFRVVRCLGRGGMGEVYEAENTLSGTRRALKRIRPTLMASSDSRERFLREVALSQRVRHPNVVECFDPFMVDDQVVLPMELLVGETLAARLRAGALSPNVAASLISTLARGAGALHREGLIHRDLKPGNIFLARSDDGSETPKILDLGATSVVVDRRLTATGFSIGTVAYMAPEQMRGERVLDARVDVYALGVLFYLCLTGRRPLEDDEHGSILVKHKDQVPIQPPRLLGVEVPHGVEEVVMRALARKREYRYADGNALADAIDDARRRPSMRPSTSLGDAWDAPHPEASLAGAEPVVPDDTSIEVATAEIESITDDGLEL